MSQRNFAQDTNNNITVTDINNILTHGLLAEDFKQNILSLVQGHQLDIQTKAIILDSILLATNIAARQQTQLELAEYQKKNTNITSEGVSQNHRFR